MSLSTQERDDVTSVVAVPGDDEPAGRGSLTIADKVVSKIAAHAVSEIDLATGAPRTVLGMRLGAADGRQNARADAHVDGQLVSMVVTVAVRWPASVRQVCAQVRQHLAARVNTLTGLQVAEIDVVVPTLITGRKPAPRVQ